MNKNEMQEYIKKLQRHVLTLEAKVLTIREIAEDKVEATHQEVRDAIIDELDAEDRFYAYGRLYEALIQPCGMNEL